MEMAQLTYISPSYTTYGKPATPHIYIPLTNPAKVDTITLSDRERTQDTEKIHNLAKIPKVICGRAGVRTQLTQLPSLRSFLYIMTASKHNFPLNREVGSGR